MKVVERHLDRGGSAKERAETGVLLLHLGGPDRGEDVERFYLDLWAQPEIVPKRKSASLAEAFESQREEIALAYSLIGNRSPIADLVAAQALALENHLANRPVMALPAGGRYLVKSGLRFGRDSIESGLRALLDAGVARVVAIPLYPQKSLALGGLCLAELDAAARGLGAAKKLKVVDSFAAHPQYLDAMVDKTRRAIDLVPPDLREGVFLLFAVHSPPGSRAKADGYLGQVEATAQAIMRRVGFDEDRSAVAFQAFRAPAPELEPSVVDFVTERARAGVKAIVVVPTSYVVDAFETLHELDIRAYQAGAEHGVRQMRRVPSLNADPLFIAALADLVKRAER